MTKNYKNVKKDFLRLMSTAAIVALLGACAVGPDYKRPSADVPEKYKENASWHEDWTTAEPADAFKRGAWWEIFGDAKLNELEAQVDGANQSLGASRSAISSGSSFGEPGARELFPDAERERIGHAIRPQQR